MKIKAFLSISFFILLALKYTIATTYYLHIGVYYDRLALNYAVPRGYNTREEFKSLINNVMNHVRILFAKLTQYEIHIQLTHEIVDTMYENGNITFNKRSLKSFCRYAHTTNQNRFHHHLLLTGFTMESENLQHRALAFQNRMCKRHKSCSIVQFRTLSLTSTMSAHEIGHSIGLRHIPTSESAHVRSIMASNIERQSHTWLLSSINVIRSKLTRKCLRRNLRGQNNYTEILFPGVNFNATKQCQFSFGLSYEQSENGNELCQSLECVSEEQQDTKSEFVPPFSGTPCGSNEYCFNEECIPDYDDI